ncbi:MAG: methyl-accepting chemotaxis protein [Deltaproteobacteria bacterium]|nr:methyl-accepting chemotaxis protein [Deltaproteobacteria bacterium]
MRSITSDLEREFTSEAQRHVRDSEHDAEQSIRAFVMVGAGAVFVSVIIALFLNRIIARPLQAISAVAEKVSSGDLTVKAPVENRPDEVGVLSQTFKTMVERLLKQTRDIMEAVNVLASSSNEIAATTAQLASGSEQTSVAVTETTTTVEEVKQTASVSSQKAKHVSELAQDAVQVSQTGTKLVKETIDGISHIREQMEYIAETIVKLSEHNQSIGDIIASVDDLAEQSNLLAVNASIEAAKAGEHGKGFIVVAQEIKSLAEQSKQATKQVRTILNDIQKSSTTAVMATEKGSKAVEATVKQSSDTGVAIQELSRSIAEASQAVMQIAASNQQQLVGMDQVAMAMTNIKQATAQNAASTKQVEVTVRNLQDLGQRLKKMVEHYRV